MKIKRYLDKDMRHVLRRVREDQGPDAVILSNRRVDEGIEVIAAIDYDEALVRHAVGMNSPHDAAINSDALARIAEDDRKPEVEADESGSSEAEIISTDLYVAPKPELHSDVQSELSSVRSARSSRRSPAGRRQQPAAAWQVSTGVPARSFEHLRQAMPEWALQRSDVEDESGRRVRRHLGKNLVGHEERSRDDDDIVTPPPAPRQSRKCS